jgi:putative Holliday junction resolvase
MGKILAIDFGLKRTGLAITDEAKMFAFGLDTIDSRELIKTLKALIPKEKIELVVLGMPKRMNNEDSHISENVRLLKVALEEELSGVEVVLYDERFTSKMASQSMHMAGATKKQKGQKELVDKVSATLILQSYLEHLAHS